MANYGNDPYGRKTLPRYYESYVEWFDTRRRVRRISRKSRADGQCVDVIDLIDMMEILLENHQMTFTIDNTYRWRLFFPYMFVKPEIGDEIRNKTTGEVYTIQFVEELPPNFRRHSFGPIERELKVDIFTGLVILEQGTTAPVMTDILEFVDKDKRLIPFQEWGSRKHSKVPSSSGEGDVGQGEQGRFLPTLTWSLIRTEPGSINGEPFGKQKQLKSTFRETFPDPAYTYLLDSEGYIEAKKEQSLYMTGTPIITGRYDALTQAQADPRVSTHNIEVYGQWFDNLVQFDCWSTSNNEANALIAWFEDFMELYTPILKQNGVSEMLYWERLQDQTIERWRNDIDNRTLRWYFRTEKIRVRRKRNFRKFNFRISLSPPTGEIRVYSEPTGIGYYTGIYGNNPHQVSYDNFTGVTGHFTGDGSYLWGRLTIEER